MSGRAECAPSNFKGLRGMTSDVVSRLLSDVVNKTIELKNLNSECKKIKDLKNLKSEFVKQVGLGSWKEAKENYPYYVTDKKLQEFSFDKKNKPSADFLAYCRKAIASKQSAIIDTPDSSTVELTIEEIMIRSFIFGTETPVSCNYQLLSGTITGFPGFKLIFATLGENYEVSKLQ